MSLNDFKTFAAENMMLIFDTFEGKGDIERVKGGDAAYFPEAGGGVLIPSLGEPIYFGGMEKIAPLVKAALNKSKNQEQQTTSSFRDWANNMPLEEKSEPFPIDLSSIYLERPTGLAGEICDYLNKTAHRQIPLIYPLVALHTLAMIAGEHKGHHGGKLNLFTLAIAPSASGKEHGQGWFAQIASELKLGRHVVGGIASDVDMIRNLVDGDGHCCYRIDEIQALFNAIKNKNANTYENKIGDLILTLITSKMYLFTGNHRRHFLEQIDKDITSTEKKLKALKDVPSDSAHGEYEELDRDRRELTEKREYIENGWPDPMVSIMGHSTPEELDNIVSAKNINSGLIGRCLLIRCGDTRAQLNDNQSASSEQHKSILSRLDKIKRERKSLLATPKAKEMFRAIRLYYDDDDRRNHPTLGAVYSRALEQINKVCNLLAIESGTVDVEHVRYAIALIERNIKDIGYLMRKAQAQSSEASSKEIIEHTKELILRNIQPMGTTPSKLKQNVIGSYVQLKKLNDKAGDSNDFYDMVLIEMISDGSVIFHEEGKRKRYIIPKQRR